MTRPRLLIAPLMSVRSAGIAALVTLALAGGQGSAQAQTGACTPGRVELRSDSGRIAFNVEIADDSAERAQGLMFRESMRKSSGMLFVYEQPGPARFWMKNTLIPLDIIFADATGVVTRVHADARPLDETSIDGGDGVQFVLEINAGLAKAAGIAAGTQLRHPAIAQDTAAWSCAAP